MKLSLQEAFKSIQKERYPLLWKETLKNEDGDSNDSVLRAELQYVQAHVTSQHEQWNGDGSPFYKVSPEKWGDATIESRICWTGLPWRTLDTWTHYKNSHVSSRYMTSAKTSPRPESPPVPPSPDSRKHHTRKSAGASAPRARQASRRPPKTEHKKSSGSKPVGVERPALLVKQEFYTWFSESNNRPTSPIAFWGEFNWLAKWFDAHDAPKVDNDSMQEVSINKTCMKNRQSCDWASAARMGKIMTSPTRKRESPFKNRMGHHGSGIIGFRFSKLSWTVVSKNRWIVFETEV